MAFLFGKKAYPPQIDINDCKDISHIGKNIDPDVQVQKELEKVKTEAKAKKTVVEVLNRCCYELATRENETKKQIKDDLDNILKLHQEADEVEAQVKLRKASLLCFSAIQDTYLLSLPPSCTVHDQSDVGKQPQHTTLQRQRR